MNDTSAQPTAAQAAPDSTSPQQAIYSILYLLKVYFDHCYYTPEAREMLSKQERVFKDKHFTFSVLEDGNIEALVKETGTRIVYGNIVITVPPRKDSIDNVEFKVKIVNKDHIPVNEIEWAEGISIWVSSFFQRTIAATFFARMAPETLQQIASQLVLVAEFFAKEEQDRVEEEKVKVTA